MIAVDRPRAASDENALSDEFGGKAAADEPFAMSVSRR